MNKYTFGGTVYYWKSVVASASSTIRDKISVQTVITIEAPSLEVAKAIIANYGMDEVKHIK